MSSPRKQKLLEHGQRVYLRTPASADAKELIAIVRASRALHRPWVYPGDTKAAFDGYIRRTREKDYAGFLICRRSDDRIVGMANLSHIFRGNLQSAYLGFWASAESILKVSSTQDKLFRKLPRSCEIVRIRGSLATLTLIPTLIAMHSSLLPDPLPGRFRSRNLEVIGEIVKQRWKMIRQFGRC